MGDSTAKFLKGIGIEPREGYVCPIWEDDFIKFMAQASDEAEDHRLNSEQADQFQAWLRRNGWSYQRIGHRSFLLISADAMREVDRIHEAIWPGTACDYD